MLLALFWFENESSIPLVLYDICFFSRQMFLESCKEPYRSIDKVHLELKSFEDIVETLKKSCALFDIQPPDEKNLKACRRELKLIKVSTGLLSTERRHEFTLSILLMCVVIYTFSGNRGKVQTQPDSAKTYTFSLFNRVSLITIDLISQTY